MFFNCSGCSKLKNILELSQSLLELNCGYTDITKLPIIPVNLLSLSCYNTKIIEIPDMSDNLEYLNCSYCFSLKSIGNNNLSSINAVSCRSLLSINIPEDCSSCMPGCIWLEGNIEEKSIERLKKIQKSFRRGFETTRFLRKSRYRKYISKIHIMKKLLPEDLAKYVLEF